MAEDDRIGDLPEGLMSRRGVSEARDPALKVIALS